MSYGRTVSTVERYYISCDEPGKPSPCVNQIVIIGKGSVDMDTLRCAVTLASVANPGSCLKLTGHLGLSRWCVAEHGPRFRFVVSDWDGTSSEGADFLNEPLDIRSGITSEVILVTMKNDKYAIVVKSHHGTMDGRGTQHFAQEIFRVLNGQALLGENNDINDVQLARKISAAKKASDIGPEIPPVTQKLEIDSDEIPSRWLRKTILGKHKHLLAKIALSIAGYGFNNGCETVRIQLPVDMRSHIPGIQSTANLTGGIVIDVFRHMSELQWNSEIKRQVKEKKEAETPRFFKVLPFHLLSWVPLKLMKKSNDKLVAKRRKTNLYRTSGIISNLGRIRLANFSGAGFIPESIFFIPPEFDTTALFVTLTGHENGIELLMRTPSNLDAGQLETLCEHVVSSLNKGSDQLLVG